MKIDSALKNIHTAEVFLTYGANFFSKWHFRKKVENHFNKIPRTVVFGDEADLFDKAETGGIIPEQRLVIVEDFSEVQSKKSFYELIDRSPKGSIYLLQSDKREKVDTVKSFLEVDCSDIKLTERDFFNRLKTWSKDYDFNLTDGIIKHLYSVTGGDLFQTYHEIEKISLYAEATNSAHLSMNELYDLTGPRIDTDSFSFSKYFLEKKTKLALNELLRWKNEDIILQTHNHFKSLERALLAATCKEQGMSVDRIVEETNIPSWYFKFVYPDIENKWSREELLNALKDCVNAIFKAKKFVNLAVPTIMESVLRRCQIRGS